VSDIDDVNAIEDYIAANRDRYTDEALTSQLLDAGHDRTAIEAALSRARAAPSAAVGKPGTGTYLLALLLSLGYLAACGLALVAVSAGGVVTMLMLTYIVAMAIGGVWSIQRLLKAPTREAGGSAIATAAAISIVVFIGISGACFALLGPAVNANGGL